MIKSHNFRPTCRNTALIEAGFSTAARVELCAKGSTHVFHFLGISGKAEVVNLIILPGKNSRYTAADIRDGDG